VPKNQVFGLKYHTKYHTKFQRSRSETLKKLHRGRNSMKICVLQ